MFFSNVGGTSPINKIEKRPTSKANTSNPATESKTKNFDQTFGSSQAFHPGQAQLFKSPSQKVFALDYKYSPSDADKRATINGEKSYKSDGIEDVAHGKLVSSYITHETEVKALEGNQPECNAISNHLQDIIDNQNPEDVGSINLSIGVDYPIDKLAEYSGVEGLTPDNLKDKAPEVVEGLKKAVDENLESEIEYSKTKEYSDEKFKRQTKLMMAFNATKMSEANTPENEKALDEFDKALLEYREMDKYQELAKLVEIHDQIDKLTEKGIPVCIASGNAGGTEDNNVNALTLNSKAITVGARDHETGKVEDYSQENSLVDVRIKTTIASNVDGKLDVNADGTGDIDINKFSKVKKHLADNPDASAQTLRFNIDMEGTSFAAPQAADLAAYMKEQGIKPDEMNEIFQQADKMVEENPELTVKQAITSIISGEEKE